jgi:citrate lyase subunit alpha/citrate CoA-transferase
VEMDRDFNVNVTVGGDGRLIGGPGGHPDAAQGAALTIVTTGLVAGGYAKLVDHARAVTTKGADVDVLVSDQGIAVNPKRPDIADDLRRAGVSVEGFDALAQRAAQTAQHQRVAPPQVPRLLIEDRWGGVLDWA